MTDMETAWFWLTFMLVVEMAVCVGFLLYISFKLGDMSTDLTYIRRHFQQNKSKEN